LRRERREGKEAKGGRELAWEREGEGMEGAG